METFDLVLLANSRKHGGRCIAGLRLDSLVQRKLTWVRLIDQEHGGIWESRTRLVDGSYPGVLDVVRVRARPLGTPTFQVENLQVDDSEWQKIHPSPPDQQLLNWLNASIDDESSWLFGFSGDYLEYEAVARWADPETLTLVHPRDIIWNVTTGQKGRPRFEVTFYKGNAAAEDRPFTLVVTDPAIETLLAEHGPGIHNESEVNIQGYVGYRWDAPSEDLVFAISLSEPWPENGRSYKLVAGVTTLPKSSDGPVTLAAAAPGNDIVETLGARGLTIVDRRPQGGRLWVVGGAELGEILKTIFPGRRFILAEHGGRATEHKPGWFLT